MNNLKLLRRLSSTLGFQEARIVQRDGRPIYLDLQATTPLDPRVLDAMLPFETITYGNPHSRTHSYGWEAESAVETARKEIATLIGASEKEIIFTSGATEAANLAIKGISAYHQHKKRIITTQIEHKCVLDSCRDLRRLDVPVTYLPVGPELRRELATGDVLLVSIMAVNNEIGVSQPLAEIGTLCRQAGAFFFTDAAQAVGKIPIDVEKMSIDMLSISGHKLYGPKGIGALFVRRRPRIRLTPLITGGGQERGFRAGTLPVPLVVGLGAACRIARTEHKYDAERIAELSSRLLDGLAKVPRSSRNGGGSSAYPGCVNVSFSCVEGESLLMALKNIALSSGSACTSASLEPSYVLRALGRTDELAHSSIRFGIGRFTTEEEIDYCISSVVHHVARLRELSPLWEMVEAGVDLSTIQWNQK